MVNRNSPKKSPRKMKISNQKAKAEHKERTIEKTTVEWEDNTLHQSERNLEENAEVDTVNEKEKVNLFFFTKFGH